MPPLTPLTLSVCVPACNEVESLQGAVEDLLKQVAPSVVRLEIVIVDDGSQDGTGPLADALAAAHPEVRVLHHPRNVGFGLSYRDGLAAATGEWFTYFPADHENVAAELVQAIPHVQPGVLVTTHHVSTDPRPWSRRWLSRTYTFLVNRISGLGLHYYNGLTFYPTAVLQAMPLGANGFLMQAEAMVRLSRRGYRVVQLEYPLGKRKSGCSAAVRLPALRQAVRDCLRIWSAGRRGR